MKALKSYWSFLKANALKVALTCLLFAIFLLPFVGGYIAALRKKLPGIGKVDDLAKKVTGGGSSAPATPASPSGT